MAIEGPLRELGIEDVLQLMELSRKTGILTVRSEKRGDEAVIHFENGNIVFAMRRRSMRRLGQQLLRTGKVTERELERALELQRQTPGQKLGQILLEMGSVNEEELRRQLHFQIEESIYDLMAWDEGHFRFEETTEVSQDYMFRVRVESLLMEGARRIDEWSRLEPKIPSLDVVPAMTVGESADGKPLDLHPDEWAVLAEIDGERDLRQIAANLGRSSFDVAKIVYGLVSTGIVEVEEGPTRGSQQQLTAGLREIRELLGQKDFEAAARVAAELEAIYPERSELALYAGQALASQGRMRAATEAFSRAVGLDPLLAPAHYALGFAAAHIGELDRAERAWDAYLRLVDEGDRARVVKDGLTAVKTLKEILGQEQPSIDEDARTGRFATME